MVSHHTHIDDVLFGTTGDQLDRLEVVYGEPPKGESMKKKALVAMFGIDDDGKTASINVKKFKPFFYIKVDNNFNCDIEQFFDYIDKEPLYSGSISQIYKCQLIVL